MAFLTAFLTLLPFSKWSARRVNAFSILPDASPAATMLIIMAGNISGECICNASESVSPFSICACVSIIALLRRTFSVCCASIDKAVYSGIPALTILTNCAREPEVADLAHFLNSAGAKITGAGKNEIMIQGVASLNGVEYTPIADRIFAATVLSAVNACKGGCMLKNYPAEYMESFEKLLKSTGLKVFHLSDSAVVFKTREKRADITVHTGYYPSFPTDMGPLLSSAVINNSGSLHMYETVFENRFSYMDEFRKLGIACRAEGREYFQQKKNDAYIAQLQAKDLRAGAAIVVAALAKRGCFTIEGINFIDRGYEKIEEVFYSLGADIRRVSLGREKTDETE